jgi:hypothetical protein
MPTRELFRQVSISVLDGLNQLPMLIHGLRSPSLGEERADLSLTSFGKCNVRLADELTGGAGAFTK